MVVTHLLHEATLSEDCDVHRKQPACHGDNTSCGVRLSHVGTECRHSGLCDHRQVPQPRGYQPVPIIIVAVSIYLSELLIETITWPTEPATDIT